MGWKELPFAQGVARGRLEHTAPVSPLKPKSPTIKSTCRPRKVTLGRVAIIGKYRIWPEIQQPEKTAAHNYAIPDLSCVKNVKKY